MSQSSQVEKVDNKRAKRIEKAFTKSEKAEKTSSKSSKEPTKKGKKEEEEKSEVVDYQVNKGTVRKDDLAYEKLSMHEQILLRPNMYIGSCTTITELEPVWTFDNEAKRIVKKNVPMNDGLLRIFIEVVSNAIDNVWRSSTVGINPKFIKIYLSKNEVSVWNDGRNIPTGLHEKEKIHVPEMIFGHLLTSSNYNDNEERKTSGTNGLGGKVANVFSSNFSVQIFNKEEKVLYEQAWENNMKTCQKPVLTKNPKQFKTAEEGKNGFTKVTFQPDFARFGFSEFTEEMLNHMRKIVYDTAMTVSIHKVSVFLNDEEVKMNKLTDYVSLYYEEAPSNMITFQTADSYVVLAPNVEWCHVSFVNGIFTRDGGVHVDKWAEAIFRPIIEKLNGSKGKGIDMRDVKKHFFLFVYADLDKPKFNDQSKHKLNAPFPTVEVKPAQIAKIMKWDFVEKIEEGLKAKDMQVLQKNSERKRGTVNVEGLEDANLAGKGKADCVLCIAEGTEVNLGQFSVKLEEIKKYLQAFDEVDCVAFSNEENGLIKSNITNFFDKGKKDCITLTLADGRKLTCTSDHKILTSEKKYVMASKLLNKKVACGYVSPKLEFKPSDFLINTTNRQFRCNTLQSFIETYVFCKILGAAVTDGNIREETKDNFTSKRVCLYFGHQLDAENACKDISFLTLKDVKYTSQKNNSVYCINLPSELAITIHDVVCFKGARINQITHIPAFIMDITCPSVFIASFLSGCFGGDGHCPCIDTSRNSPTLTSIKLSLSKIESLSENLEQHANEYKQCLEKVGIPCTVRNSRAKKHYGNIDRERTIERCICISNDYLLDFSDKIGFAYCIHKQVRLTYAYSFYSYKKVFKEQQIKRLQDIQITEGNTLIDKIKNHNLRFHSTNDFIKYDFSCDMRKEVVYSKISKIDSWCPKGTENTKSLEKFLDSIDGLKKFIKIDNKTTYGVDSNDLAIEPIFIDVIDIRPAGNLSVYDISVDSLHNFQAGPMIVHNCISEGMSARTYVVAGMKHGFQTFKGRDTIGVLPIRGKFLNVKNASAVTLSKNTELIAITQALGLTYGTDYTDDKNFSKLRYKKLVLASDSDSVTGDTPLLLKKDGKIEVRTIDDIAEDEWIQEGNKLYNKTTFQVWTERGWTNIKHIMKHKTTKKLFRVLTHTGVVDVTEDHSLLNEEAQEIRPEECKVGELLLHSFPKFAENSVELPENLDVVNIYDLQKMASSVKIPYIRNYNKDALVQELTKYRESVFEPLHTYDTIAADLAWVMGFFWADGTCGIYKYQLVRKPENRPREYTFNRTNYAWALSNTNKSYLTKALPIMERHYPDFEWKIIEDRHSSQSNKNCKMSYRLICNGGKVTAPLIEQWRNLFYDANKMKRIPVEILNASREVRENFLEGYLYGDGNKESDGETLKTTEIKFDIFGKIGTQGIFTLCKSLGYLVSLNTRKDKPNVYSINLTKGTQQFHSHKIKKIIPLGETETEVYDLETENHHFQAGIGQMIVHNTDGHHITGLIYNLFHTLFPSLLKRKGFFSFMRTPIIKITQGKKAKPINFYFYEQAKKYIDEQKPTSTHIRYFKGLGTSRDEDIKQDFGKRIVEVELDEKGDKMMENVFGGDESDFRKQWIQSHESRTNFPEVKEGDLEHTTITDFLNLELINYSIDHCKRSIPCIMDGLKESQRKILYAGFKRNLKYNGESLKVAQFGAYTAEHSNYHHGEANLYDTIVKMAQRFVGSNNLALFLNDGQMGSRSEYGKDAAAARYIFTKLDMCTRYLFREEDEPYLSQRMDDGDLVEPETYYPIIPLILVNGTAGSIASGWSSTIPPYHLKDIISWIKAWLYEKETPELAPHFRGFKGKVSVQDNKVITEGTFEQTKKGICVTEIPIGKRMMSINKYKEFLKDLQESGKIKSIEDQSSENHPCLYIKCADEFTPTVQTLQLSDSISLSNMVMFDTKGKLQKYESIVEILAEWCDVRFDQYEIRKKGQLEAMEVEKTVLYNRIRFMQSILDEKLVLKNKDEDMLCKELLAEKYDQHKDSFDYLLNTSVKSMTSGHLKDLQGKYTALCESIRKLAGTSIKTIWSQEMDELLAQYEKWCGMH
jgi:DNA gyrase/topoisomerase IV subunit B